MGPNIELRESLLRFGRKAKWDMRDACFPIHEVANWLGHCPTVAMKHYTQVSKEQTAKAANVNLGKSVLRFGRNR